MTWQKERLQGKPDCEQGQQLPFRALPKTQKKSMRTNGLRYPQVGGLRFCLGAGKTQSQKNACKPRRIPLVVCTLCWAVFDLTRTLTEG